MLSDVSIASAHLTLIQNLLRTHLQSPCTVWAYGSRTQGAFKRYSDLDLAIIEPENVDVLTMAKLRMALEESDLPFKVDIVEFAALSDAFKEIVERDHVVIP